ncbi:hypothetical protein [Dankookia sp. P2]|uniref:baeRF11 domain-containing protein n=1 Tax=Dankookia sp. P2 TaxID=3423955 RepID=UPI003D664919
MLHVDLPSRAEIQALGEHRGWPAVSIALPTTPLTQEAQADRTVLRNLIRAAVAEIDATGANVRVGRAVEALLAPLAEDDAFWAHQANGLAIYATPEGVRAYRLPGRVEARVQVADRFGLKPLLQALATPQEAMVLAIGMGAVRLLEVTAGMPAEAVRVPDLPRGAADAAGRGSHVARKGDMASGLATSENALLSHYARAVDRALRPVLAGLEVPLVLAAAEPMASVFRSVCTYPRLAAEGIAGSPDDVADQALGTAARQVLEGLRAAELAALGGLFAQREAQDRATTDVARAARAASFGAVDTLLVDLDAALPGTLGEEDGAVDFAGAGSLTDEIARRALAAGGRVLAARPGEIPGGGPLAAILRYPV